VLEVTLTAYDYKICCHWQLHLLRLPAPAAEPNIQMFKTCILKIISKVGLSGRNQCLSEAASHVVHFAGVAWSQSSEAKIDAASEPVHRCYVALWYY
jgi:hypothetical protein